MSLSRRKFLRAGTLVAISAGIPFKSIVAETLRRPGSFLPANGSLNSASNLNQASFSRCLNTKFSFSAKDVHAVTVKLVEVYDLSPAGAANGKECFGIVFAGPRNAPMRQETYAVSHETLGKFEMLVVPIASRKQGLYYEAIFNRLH